MASKPYPVGSNAYLEALLENEPTFQFTSIDSLERTVQGFKDPIQSQYLVYKGVPYNTFEQLVDNEQSITFHERFLYLHDTESLRIKMRSGAHEAAIGEFIQLLTKKLTVMGVIDEITPRHSALKRLGNVSKEPDGAWGPLVPERYATCILEVGMSEPQHKLQLDARLWLELPESLKCHIHQVITINIHHDKPRIDLQKWEQSRREYGKTRTNHPRRAIKTEEVQVSLVNNVPVVTGSLRLSFSKLFERPPIPETSEGDIIFTSNELIALAKEVWIEQPNIIAREMVV